jgi:E3 ubiquitin-protein ligase SDIR1
MDGYLETVRLQQQMLRERAFELCEALSVPPWAGAQVYDAKPHPSAAHAVRLAELPPPRPPVAARPADADGDGGRVPTHVLEQLRAHERARVSLPLLLALPPAEAAAAAARDETRLPRPRAATALQPPPAVAVGGALAPAHASSASASAAIATHDQSPADALQLLSAARARMGSLGIGSREPAPGVQQGARRPLTARRPASASARAPAVRPTSPACTVAAASATLQRVGSAPVAAMRAIEAAAAFDLGGRRGRGEEGAAVQFAALLAAIELADGAEPTRHADGRMFARMRSAAAARSDSRAGGGRDAPARPPELAPRGLSALALSRLVSFVAASPSAEPCCICLEHVCAGERAVALECAHVFHDGCVRLWLRRQAACPLCKRDPGPTLGL